MREKEREVERGRLSDVGDRVTKLSALPLPLFHAPFDE